LYRHVSGDDPKDAANVTVQFAAVPGGPNHASIETINGVSKQLPIAIQNNNYHRQSTCGRVPVRVAATLSSPGISFLKRLTPF